MMTAQEAIRVLRELETLDVSVRITIEIDAGDGGQAAKVETLAEHKIFGEHETFGDRLKRARKEKRLRQKDLGEAVGVSTTSIQAYERGDYKPKYEVMQKLSAVLGRSTDYLCGRK